MTDKHKDIESRLYVLLNDARKYHWSNRIGVDIKPSGDCVLTTGKWSALLKPDDPARCVAIFKDDSLEDVGLPISWIPDRLPLLRQFLRDWFGSGIPDSVYLSIRFLVLVINKNWSDLVANLTDLALGHIQQD